ncbi:MAG: hypothetical protein K9M82_00370, partial [Deltaproteobacteria bacterium]|nr:hypothetical protein [Deltaproteobacteria bacterium]
MKLIPKLLILLAMLLGLPLLGIIAGGMSVDPYLEFPPRTRFVSRAPFSWPVFWGLTLLIAGVVAPLVFRGFHGRRSRPGGPERPVRTFPWWGWAGVAVSCGAWVLAWNRFSWLGQLQNHT